jgi:hypothetical protein
LDVAGVEGLEDPDAAKVSSQLDQRRKEHK